MKLARYPLLLLALPTMAGLGGAAKEPLYDEKADAQQQIAAALGQASKAGTNVLLIFGANW